MGVRNSNYIEKQICNRLYRLKNYVNFRVNSRIEAEDVYSDTVLKIWKIMRNGKFREGFSLDAFMWLCAKSEISDYFKKENREKRKRDDEYAYYCSTVTRSPEKVYEASVENKIFMEKVGKKLNDVYRKVLILLLFQNMKHYEIADTLGMNRNTVSKYVMKMRRELGNVHLNQVRTRMGIR